MNSSVLNSELDAVRAIIAGSIEIDNPAVAQAVSELASAGGKFLRPRILILSAMTGRYDPEKIRPLAAAVELLHIATLIHDDIIDDSPVRRGVPAVHTSVGKKNAVLAGDYLFSRCIRLASASTSPDNARHLARAIGVIVSAEMRQDADRWIFTPSIRRCVRKIMGKTAILFSLASRSGAEESRANSRIVSALTRASIAAGIAFQIQDDILDWTADERTLGKAVLHDIDEGLCTLPVAFALAGNIPSLPPLLAQEAILAGSREAVREIVISSGALQKTADQAQLYCDRALRGLSVLPPSFARDELSAVFSSFITRDT